MRIEIDGNDGTGKTTVVGILRGLGFDVQDRGLMTKATISAELLNPECNVKYVLLDASVETSRTRLLYAGANLDEQYHTVEDLTCFRGLFLRIATRFQAAVINTDNLKPLEVAAAVASEVNGRMLRIAVPSKGHLTSHSWPLPEDICQAFPKTPNGRLWIQRFGMMVFYVRPRAVPDLIAHGLVDVGVTGSDLLQNSVARDQIEVVSRLQQYGVRLMRLAVAGASPVKGRPLIVASTLRGVANEVYGKTAQPFMVIEVEGATEGLCPILCDEVLDIVETGKTAEHNLLVVREDLGEVSVVTIKRRRE